MPSTSTFIPSNSAHAMQYEKRRKEKELREKKEKNKQQTSCGNLCDKRGICLIRLPHFVSFALFEIYSHSVFWVALNGICNLLLSYYQFNYK